MRFISVSVWKMETKMGTYTTNYQLYMPTVGEQGWGDLVNGNFSIIDTTMAGLNTRLIVVESGNFENGIVTPSVTVDYIGFNGIATTTSTGVVYATSTDVGISLSEDSANPTTFVATSPYTYNTLPLKISDGYYFISVEDNVVPSTIVFRLQNYSNGSTSTVYIRESGTSDYASYKPGTTANHPIIDVTLNVNTTYECYRVKNYWDNSMGFTLLALPTKYVTYKDI